MNRKLLIALALIAGLAPAALRAEEEGKKWNFDFTLYSFLSSLTGDVVVRGNPASADLRISELLENMEFAAAGKVRIGYERWFTALDVNYVGLGGSSGNVGFDLDQWIVEPTLGYQVTENVEVFAGARYMSLDLELRFAGPLGLQPSGVQDWWDPVVGAAYHRPLGRKFSFDLSGDIGGFSVGSRLSTQGELMFNWHISHHIALQLGYRALYNDYTDDGAGFAYDVLMHGPQVGFKVSF